MFLLVEQNMNSYDVILHFELVNLFHIQKYLFLNKKLNEFCKSLLILNSGDLGISSDLLSRFREEDLFNVCLKNNKDACELLNEKKYKIYVFGNGGTKDYRPWLEISNKKSKTIEISDLFGDFYNFSPRPHIVSLINPLLRDIFAIKCQNIIYSNCLLWDRIDECLPYKLSKEDFFKKYSLDINLPLMVWFPDNICFNKDKTAADVYNRACDLNNVIVKLHPNEYKKCANKYGGLYSNVILDRKSVKILDFTDTHWCYKYMDCGLAYSSSIGIELPIYKKPCIYIDVDKKENVLFSEHYFKGNFSWVGTSCKLNEIEKFISEKRYVADDIMYNNHLKKFLAHPERRAVDVLVEQIKEFLT